MNLAEFLFPHDTVRNIQDALLQQVKAIVENKGCLVVHAPTGLGKTAATLGPALSVALQEGKTVFFLTSRHTQHQIALETARQISRRYSRKIVVADVIGKKWMCLQQGAEQLYTRDFFEYCKALREDGKCEYYENLYKGNKITPRGSKLVSHLMQAGPMSSEEINTFAGRENLCPYYTSLKIACSANLVISDYYYIFAPAVADSFLNRIGREMEDIIVIVDEAHNLPARARELLSYRLSSSMINRAIAEADKFGFRETSAILAQLLDVLNRYAEGIVSRPGSQVVISEDDFLGQVDEIRPVAELVDDLERIAEEIRKRQRQSSVAGVAAFISAWSTEEEGFIRYFEIRQGAKEPVLFLNLRCIDPSIVTSRIFREAYASVLMSGTLTPPEMYREILGCPDDAVTAVYSSPFPQKNRLNLVVPYTTTKFTERNPAQYRNISRMCADIANAVPGNVALFFPSYFVRDEVERFFSGECRKTVIAERPDLTKKEKLDMLEKFKSHSSKGAVLLGVVSGNFGEGIDLKGDFLKAVVVVGLPLLQPDIVSKAAIQYYDMKFRRGWDYGYVFPSFNKTIQSAGRCIRSETDRGVIVFLDERYTLPQYARCFPRDWELKVSANPVEEIKAFFRQ